MRRKEAMIYLRDSEITELINLYHLAKGYGTTRYERMLKAADWFAREHPECSSTRAYKELVAATRNQPSAIR